MSSRMSSNKNMRINFFNYVANWLHLEIDPVLFENSKVKRSFSAMALNTCELMILSIQGLRGKTLIDLSAIIANE